jgi:hypothetical protein
MVTCISFGGGTNSAAMVIGMLDRVETIDHILFADTGGEKPNTYRFIKAFGAWVEQRGIRLTVVSNAGRGQGDSLEDNCLKRHELPSLAYGFKGCSVKWKRQPMDRYLRGLPDVKQSWERGELVTRCIGIGVEETRRKKLPPDDKWTYRYPLVEWGWDRAACVEAIKRAGLPQPGKSSCFFCPAAKKQEVLDLAEHHPDLFARAVAMERNSNAHKIKGLGRHWSWGDLVRVKAPHLLPETLTHPCDCIDDGEDDDGGP